jgi:uncharacterized membrane protein YphA (DoxX/SURF4 family)
MLHLYYLKNDWKSFLYAIVRVGLGLYLISHAILNLIHYDDFIEASRHYVPEGSGLEFLAYFTPAVPMLEFFIALMILGGLYTRLSLQWAIGLGIFFTILFHYTGDMETALVHSYTLSIKLILLFMIYYNKFSADYYNIWMVLQEKERQSRG